MIDLADYYNKRVDWFEQTNFLEQVGHTEDGCAINNDQFDLLVNQIIDLLELSSDDHLLDICCGNGIITRILSNSVQRTVGVDFSSKLIGIANEYNKTDKVQYHVANALALAEHSEIKGIEFNKILIYGALQHFRTTDLHLLLQNIAAISNPDMTIVFGFVLESGKKNYLFTTLRSKVNYIFKRLRRRDVIGHWWKREDIFNICQEHGFSCEFSEIPAGLNASYYRFNVKIKRA